MLEQQAAVKQGDGGRKQVWMMKRETAYLKTEAYLKFGPVIYSRCRRLLKDDTLAQDATPEIFVRAIRQIESAGDDRTALSRIYEVLNDYCLDRFPGHSSPMVLASH